MFRTATLLAFAGIGLTAFLVVVWPARSEEGGRLVIPISASGPLDGLSFEGMFGPADGSSDVADVLFFRDGHFWSENCIPCGFSPGPYRARRTDEGIHFEGMLESPDRGRFHYTGVVKGGRVQAHINWRKERWYWTIDKDFQFEGARTERPATASAKSMTRIALTAKPDPDKCRP